MKIYSILYISLLITACSITINSKKKFPQDLRTKLPIVKFSDVKNGANPFQFVEINAADIKTFSTSKKYTFIYSLDVWCSPCIRAFRKNYIIMDSLTKVNRDVNILVVSTTYGFGTGIEKLYRKLDFNSPIYVLDNNYYGNVTDTKVNNFVKELCDTCTPKPTNGVFVFDQTSAMKGYFTHDDEENFRWKEIFNLIK